MVEFFHTIIFVPLYNALIGILSVLPHADIGFAVIFLTVGVKILLFPVAKQAIYTQIALKKIAPEVEKIKKEVTDQKEQVTQMLAVYKANGVHPLSGFFVILVQVPVILGLYWVFMKGGLPSIQYDILYSFITPPTSLQTVFLGLIDLTKPHIFLAITAGLTQFVHARFVMQMPEITSKPGESMKDDLMRSLQLQARYVLPFLIMGVAYTLSAAIALYWTVSNLFTIGQELLIRRQLEQKNV
jgi:YidC/Oxa1 family membrane protein insertase